MQNDKQKKDGTDALVRHVVRSSPMPEPPADFAENVAMLVSTQEEDAKFEVWLTNAVLLLAIIAVIGMAIASMPSLVDLSRFLGEAPWPLILASGAMFAAIRLLEIPKLRIKQPGMKT